MKTLINKFLTYFRNIKLYESHKFTQNLNDKKFNLYLVKNLSQIKKNKNIKKYFKIFNNKKKRFSKKQYLFILLHKKNFVSSGWMTKSNKWLVTEVNLEIKSSDNSIILFDFYTPVSLRSRGYYTKLLKMILKKFKNQKFLIYSLSSNLASIKAIKNAGFYFKENLNRLNFYYDK